MDKYGFGIDIGGTTIKMGLFDGIGNVIDKWEILTRKNDNGKFILSDISHEIEKTLEEREISKEDVVGVGVGVPGPVGSDGTVFKCVNLGWDIFNVEQALGDMVQLRVRAGNDANVAALGEMWKGGGQGYTNVVMVTLGTGVGGGIIIDGRVVSGKHGAGGEIGHSKVNNEETTPCGCGKLGCLEQYASATGIVNEAYKVLNHDTSSSALHESDEITAKVIFDLAKKGDELAISLCESFGERLGMALANIACVCDPEIFVIGGGVSKAGDMLIDIVKKHYKRLAFHATEETLFSLASLGNDAGIYGAYKLVL